MTHHRRGGGGHKSERPIFLLRGSGNKEEWAKMPRRGQPGNDCPRRVDPSDPDTPPRCFYCDVRLVDPPAYKPVGVVIRPADNWRTLDHHLPAHRGGLRGQGNGVWCCTRCNSARDQVDRAEAGDQVGVADRHAEWCKNNGRKLRMEMFMRHITRGVGVRGGEE